ncbi:sporulation inhibitor of replication protein SirA [Halalkalibacillus halophilus]|uniref:sporulation inhibitor of replication protein SirA n=1 Tax=Halalkalibacillus halophilus TaxID=392827 RepID=UPI0003FDA2E0|nr:sporulation inhibitor of replication protein SirA [Halalkalibacillus halophilus]
MYQYSLFFFKPNYGEHFYFKVSLLYKLLKKYKMQSLQDGITTKQIKYALEEVKLEQLFSYLKNSTTANVNWIDEETFEMQSGNKRIIVKKSSNGLELYATSLIELETLLLKYLKKYHEYIFVLNETSVEFGWVRPYKRKKLLNHG